MLHKNLCPHPPVNGGEDSDFFVKYKHFHHTRKEFAKNIHADCTEGGLLQSCLMQLARTADCCNLASCRLHGPRIAAILLHADCTDCGLLQSCSMQLARTADCCNLTSYSLQFFWELLFFFWEPFLLFWELIGELFNLTSNAPSLSFTHPFPYYYGRK